MGEEVLTRAVDIPLKEVERVSSNGRENYKLYLKGGREVIVTREAYNRALRVANLLKEDEVQEAVEAAQRTPDDLDV